MAVPIGATRAMNRDFAEMLRALNDAGADYILVGDHAMAAHGFPRPMAAIAIWLRPSTTNAECVWEALELFGAPLIDIQRSDFASPGIVYQIGVTPLRIDLLTSAYGLEFSEVWRRRWMVPVGELRLPLLSRADLITNRRARGRPKDIADAEALEAISDEAIAR
jgi:hypothetical protein